MVRSKDPARMNAQSLGSHKYISDRPCVRGHKGARYTKSARCVQCLSQRDPAMAKASYAKLKQDPAWVNARRRSARLLAWKKHGRPNPPYAETGICECCSKPTKRSMDLDHDHDSGEFRGWLCTKCNRGIGYLGDSIEGLEMAINYLKNAYNKRTRAINVG
jgi:hypothetical protein